MRIPLDWLADYVAIEITAHDLAHRLTMSGLKVERVESIGADWDDVVVGEITELEPHPSSRKPLWVARVRLADAAITVVTGAQNLNVGDRVPTVVVGGCIPHGPDGTPMEITAKPMAGITSEAMLASERELGLSDEHSGIYILPRDAPVGVPLRNVLGGDVLEIETNPNRPDTLSIIGIAREVAAVTEQQLSLPDIQTVGDNVEWVERPSIPIEIDEPELCPRYSALRIEGIEASASPFWMASRLRAAGMRPISLLVDITNYIMLEYGQPMHAFDAALLHGGKIAVRRATGGETLRTLDGVDRQLTSDDLVITDGNRVVALAGVMGGANSEIGDDTQAIVLESANFDPVHVRRTAKRLNLRTEASARFEKGLPPETTVVGLNRYLQLLAQTSGDRRLRVYRADDEWANRPAPRTVTVPFRDLDRLLGIKVERERAAEVLSLLGFDVTVREQEIEATVPFWRRVDIEQSADLVEEVGRMIGFDAIPSTFPNHTLAPPTPLPGLYWEGVVRERLLAAGVSEVVTHALTSPGAVLRLVAQGSGSQDPALDETWSEIVPNAAGIYEREGRAIPVPLINPPTRDRVMLRPTIIATLLDEAGRNLKHGEERVALFEIARTFFARLHDLPYERRTLAIVLAGTYRSPSWQEPSPRDVSFYDLKGLLESVLAALNVDEWRICPKPHPTLHPGRSAILRLAGHDVALLGEVHPVVVETFEIDGHIACVAEVDLDTVFAHASSDRVFSPLARFPGVRRDIAVVVDQDVPAADVVQAIEQAATGLLARSRIFDIYQGESLPLGKKSIAVAMEFRAPGTTLTQEDVAGEMVRIVESLERNLRATLRD